MEKTKFYEFSQNNTGGSFIFDEKKGICSHVVIEAKNANEANERAKEIGLYFDGVDKGEDCECCGDRWYEADESDGYETPTIYGDDLVKFNGSVFRQFAFIHYLDKPFEFFDFKYATHD